MVRNEEKGAAGYGGIVMGRLGEMEAETKLDRDC